MQCNTTYYVPKVFSLAGRLKHRPSALLNKCNTKIRNTKNKSKSKTLKKMKTSARQNQGKQCKHTTTQVHNDTNTQIQVRHGNAQQQCAVRELFIDFVIQFVFNLSSEVYFCPSIIFQICFFVFLKSKSNVQCASCSSTVYSI